MDGLRISEGGSNLSISFGSDLTLVEPAVSAAFNFVSSKLPDIEPFPFKLALYEALTNAARHGNRMDHSLDVKLEVSVSSTELEMSVTDCGEGFDWRKAVEKSRGEIDSSDPGGRGIMLLEAYKYNPSYNDKGNVLTMKLKLEERA